MIVPRAFYSTPGPTPRQPASGWKPVFRRQRRGATARVARPPVTRSIDWQPHLRWLGVLLALLAGGYGLYAAAHRLLDPTQFPLRQINLQGELRNISQAELQQLVQPYLGQNVFAVDIGALQATLAAHPWIGRVSVHRQWPDRLQVYFQERTAFGYWGQAEVSAETSAGMSAETSAEMVDIDGTRFRPATVQQPGPWPRLAGPEGHETALIRRYREAEALLKPAGLQLTHLTQDERRAFRLVTAGGLEILLGREQFPERLHRLVNLYPQLLADRSGQIAAVDLRYTHGFAVRWLSPAAGSSATVATTTPAAGTPTARPKGAKAG